MALRWGIVGEAGLQTWWRLAGSLSYLDQSFRFKPGASGILGPSQAGNDPKYRASLSS